MWPSRKGDDETLSVIQQPIVLGELLRGLAFDNKIKKNRDELQQFLQSSRIKIFALTANTSQFYGQI